MARQPIDIICVSLGPRFWSNGHIGCSLSQDAVGWMRPAQNAKRTACEPFIGSQTPRHSSEGVTTHQTLTAMGRNERYVGGRSACVQPLRSATVSDPHGACAVQCARLG